MLRTTAGSTDGWRRRTDWANDPLQVGIGVRLPLRLQDRKAAVPDNDAVR